MGTTSSFKDQHHHHSLAKKLIPWTLYALLPIALLRLYFYPIPLPQSSTDQLPHHDPIFISKSVSPSSSSSSSSSSLPPPPRQQPQLPPSSSSFIREEERPEKVQCDFTNGKWVRDRSGPLYNGSSCGTIKDGQNCIAHGRPDLGYLQWRWKPEQCRLPRFEPNTFLRLIRNKHLAFVGDSMARNQLESLLCLLATVSHPKLIDSNGDDNKFRRWFFPSHNVNVSVYWSPFLVKGIEKTTAGNYNRLFFDSVDGRWAQFLGHMDMVVLSVGHWFLHPAVYFEGGKALGCHYCPGMNHTEIGFYEVFRKAVKTTLKTIIGRFGASGNGIDVIVTTFSPAHFDGDWDKAGACPKTKPYMEGEKLLEGMDAEMHKVEVEEVAAAKEDAKPYARIRLEALDVSKLSLMRPDGHPGPYMNPYPFFHGVKESVQNDCVHWCLPGPVDTWNEILLEVMKRWESESRRGG